MFIIVLEKVIFWTHWYKGANGVIHRRENKVDLFARVNNPFVTNKSQQQTKNSITAFTISLNFEALWC